MTEIRTDTQIAYDIARSADYQKAHRKWMKKRSPEVVLAHEMEALLEKAIVKLRATKGMYTEVRYFTRMYDKVVGLLKEGVVNE